MLKRSGTEEEHPSKRVKADSRNQMPPPSFVPRQPSSSATNRPQITMTATSSSTTTKFKLQTSIKDMKSHQNGYFSDDDDCDEDLWFKATQIEEQEMKALTQKHSPEIADVTYSDFQDAEGPTSTQNDKFAVPMSQIDPIYSQKLRVLQNKCSALEKQLKRSLPNIAKAQAQASQASCEVNDLKMKIKLLRAENEELRKEKLHEADRISTATGTIRTENETLRKQLTKLERKVRQSDHEMTFKGASPLDPDQVKESLYYEMIFDDLRTNYLRGLVSRTGFCRHLKYDEGQIDSKFHKHLISLQLNIAELERNVSGNSKGCIQRFNNSRFQDKSIIDDFWIFNQITKVIHEISEDIKLSGLRHLDEHFVRQEFAFKQTQYCSDQYFGDKKNSRNFGASENFLTASQKIFPDEIRVDHRRLIAIISILVGNSKKLSEMMLVQNISTKPDEYKTLIDVICEIIDPHILQSRFLYKNSGIASAFVDLLKNLSIHYGKFEGNSEIIDKNFVKFFSYLLTMSTNNPQILLNFSQFLINILRHDKGIEIVSKLCKNYPSSNLEFSYMFKIYQIPRCGCMLQIYFILLTTAFRFFEDVEQHNLDILFELTINVNTLVYLLISNGCDMEFLKPQSYESSDLKNHCKCYMFLVIALIILNNQALRHRNVNSSKFFSELSTITKTAVVSIVSLLSYSGQTIDYRSFTFGYNAINELYTMIRHGDIYVENCDKYFPCKDMLLTEDCHEEFLEKILTSTSADFSYSFVTCDSNPEENLENEEIKRAKQELWDEINAAF